MADNKELQRLLFRQQKENIHHISPEVEFKYYRRIAHGDLSILKDDFNSAPMEGMGILSENKLNNIKYHTIILIAMITRFCLEEGLQTEEAYTLSDFFIRQVDTAVNKNEIDNIKKEAVTKYTRLMNSRRKTKVSMHVVRAIDYIDANISDVIFVQDVANAVGCNADYLSRLFKRDLGIPLTRYILERKCQSAKYLLENSRSTCTEIAVFLGFSSCSHFIERFKQLEKMTPEEYRRTHFRVIGKLN